jgi:hypothetical protein
MENLRFTSAEKTYVAFETDSGGESLSVVDFQAKYPNESLPADYTPPAITWADIRSKRDGLLAATDWQAGTDVTMTDAQKAYRQALRDVPQTFANPEDVVWPTKP